MGDVDCFEGDQSVAADIVREQKAEYGEDLGNRTKKFALRIIRLYTSLPKSAVGQVLGKQVLRSGTSVGAHYHEAIRARSTAEFLSKLEVGTQELEETRYWLDLLAESETIDPQRLAPLRKEAGELLAILIACIKKARAKR